MPELSYQKDNLVLNRGDSDTVENYIHDLQEDLRRLGYLRRNIDGIFGHGTELAVKALEYDLLHNDGESTQNDGKAPVRLIDYNRGRVVDVSGSVDSNLAACISDMLIDPEFPILPKSENPREENKKVVDFMKSLLSQEVPIPFVMAILKQESGLKHFYEPSSGDKDTYIIVGLDTNASLKHIITSRGYGVGQHTLFHHPPRKEEIDETMLDVEKNIQKAIQDLKYKFDYFVNGDSTGTRADDRIVEYGDGPLRVCKFIPGDPKYMVGCKQCMIDAGQMDIQEGVTRAYEGSSIIFMPTQYYRKANYQSVPIRKNIGCDWAYAARRYNGSGINSYHYQVRIMKNILKL